VRALVLGTRNEHKLREFARLLEGVEVRPLPEGIPSPPETGETFEENALIKARAAFRATGEAAIADDSGVGAEAIGWRPGVRSARYAGAGATDERNLAKFEEEVPAGSRLRYTCVIALVTGDGETTFEGVCDGVMAEQRSGERGFGYDPVFVPDGHGGRTMADLGDAEKDAISHRGKAAAQLLEWLNKRGEAGVATTG
jgi:XTP/dITP diphosphohydrolase